jgi:hypothetical protein
VSDLARLLDLHSGLDQGNDRRNRPNPVDGERSLQPTPIHRPDASTVAPGNQLEQSWDDGPQATLTLDQHTKIPAQPLGRVRSKSGLI